jgi:uncharacterized membrane protein YfcA
MTYERIKLASFTHSTVYAILLIVWIIPGLHAAQAVFGLTHGIMWFGMCATAIYALRRGIIDLRLAIAISVLAVVGPFVGSYEFLRRSRGGVRALG